MSATKNAVTGAVPKQGPVITDWRPEDSHFWAAGGKAIATRNLWISIPALLLAFAVWMVWSTVIVRLNSIGFTFTTDQLFWLAALPGLSGATLRIFYSFMVPIFGGRRWTALSTASLLAPALWMGFAVQDPSTSYNVFVLIALLCGFGGGNFASSMSNISFFYPKAQQGTALGMNAGLGNLGVSVMQFGVPLVISLGIFGALGGIVLATSTNVSPGVYVTSLTFFLWTALLLGGAATIFGPVLGSIIFWVLQAFLTNVLPALAESGILPVSGIQAATLRYVLVGIGLMLIVIYRPQGIFGDKREMTFVK